MISADPINRHILSLFYTILTHAQTLFLILPPTLSSFLYLSHVHSFTLLPSPSLPPLPPFLSLPTPSPSFPHPPYPSFPLPPSLPPLPTPSPSLPPLPPALSLPPLPPALSLPPSPYPSSPPPPSQVYIEALRTMHINTIAALELPASTSVSIEELLNELAKLLEGGKHLKRS